jgi:ComF family protein
MQFYRGTVWRIAGQWRTLAGAGLRTAAGSAAGLLFPPRCVACHQEMDHANEILLCAACRELLIDEHRTPCPRCAAPLPQPLQQAKDCAHCRTEKFAFAGVAALGAYEGELQRAVLQMKGPAAEPLTMALGRLLGDCIARRGPLPDIAAPIPMHWLRRLGRRANAADVLAEAAASRLRIPAWPGLLAVRGLRQRQHLLTPAERRLNMRNAFRIQRGYDVAGSRVLVIDDVLTTGATAHAAAKALKKAGAAEVIVAVVARGVGA